MKYISHVAVSFSALCCTDARLASPFHQEPGTKASLLSTFPEARIDLDLVAHMADLNAMMGKTHPPGWPLAPVNANRSHGRRPYRSKHAQELFKQNHMGMGMGSVHDADHLHAESKPKGSLRMSKDTKHFKLLKHAAKPQKAGRSNREHHQRHHKSVKSLTSKKEPSEDVVNADADAESDGTTQRLVEMTDKWNKGELNDVEDLEDISQDEKIVEKSTDVVTSDLHEAAKLADSTSSDKTTDSVRRSKEKQSLGDAANTSKGGPRVLREKFSARDKLDKSDTAQVPRGTEDMSKSTKVLQERHSARGNPDSSTSKSPETLPQAEEKLEDDVTDDITEDTSTSHADVNTASSAKDISAKSERLADSDKSGMQEHMAEVLGRIRAERVATVSHSIDSKGDDNINDISESNATDEVQETHQKSNSTKTILEKRRPHATVEEQREIDNIDEAHKVVAQSESSKVAVNHSLAHVVNKEAQEFSSREQIQTNHSSADEVSKDSSSTPAVAGQDAGKYDAGQVTSEHVVADNSDGSEAQQSIKTHAEKIIDDPLPRKGKAAAELDVSKLAWLHVPKTGTSFANTLASWACPDLKESDFVGVSEGNETVLGGFMEHHGDKCVAGFSFCNGHTPVSRDSCNDWNAHEGHFVGMFREPEQRIISGYKQNCHDVPGKDHTLPEYAEMVSGCSVKMLNGQECGSNITVTSDMVKHAIRRIEEGFAFTGLTEEWALSVCLFHTMFGGKCHPREFMDVRPGLTHRDMPYDASDLHGWVDPYDGALYAHASTVFWDNIAKYDVSPDSCKRTVCADTPDEFKLSVLRQR